MFQTLVARIALGFSVADAVDDFAAAIAAVFDHAAADATADVAAAAAAGGDVASAAADMTSAAAGDDGGDTYSGDSDKSTAQLPHPPSASSDLSSSEQASAAAHANGVLDGVDDLRQPYSTLVDAEDMGGTVWPNGVPESAARGASAVPFDPASADGDPAADPDATAAAAAAAAAAGSTAHKDDNSDTPKTLQPQPGFGEAEQATTAVESGGVSSSSDGTPAPPPDARFHPGRVLKIGDRLRGTLLNSDGTAATYASPMDGSIVVERLTGEGGVRRCPTPPSSVDLASKIQPFKGLTYVAAVP